MRCLIIGLGAMIRQKKYFSGESYHGHVPFNLSGIPILSAVYEGMVREIVVAKLEAEAISTSSSHKYAVHLRKQAEHKGGIENLKKLYQPVFGCGLFDVVDNQDRTAVCQSLKAMVALRNVFAHGTILIYPDEEISSEIDGGFVKDWEIQLKNTVSKYFKETYDSENVINVLQENDVLEGFVDQLKVLAKSLQAEHGDLGIKSPGLISNYKYGFSNSL
ncbi:MAG: hypothetical protein JKY95_10935 [Planctomycetaceae bacterium]|nr:hypothetical protein [Planctomycetaceae bacterium]